MKQSSITGISPIITTPFTETGEVDYETFEALNQRLLRAGCQSTTLFGIAGEYYKLSDREMEELSRRFIASCHAEGKPAIVSVTPHATELAVERARFLAELGADCLMLLPPFFLKPSAAQVYAHAKAVAQAVNLPIMLQYAPEQTGVGIPVETFVRLTQECPNIHYYKIECKPPGAYISRLLEATDQQVAIFVGNAGFQLLECMERGATGAMPGCSMSDLYLKIYHAAASGDNESAVRLHNSLLPMLNHIRQNVEQIILYEKRILVRRGWLKNDYCRAPSFQPDATMDALFDQYWEALEPLLEN